MTRKRQQVAKDAIDELVDWQLREGNWSCYARPMFEIDSFPDDDIQLTTLYALFGDYRSNDAARWIPGKGWGGEEGHFKITDLILDSSDDPELIEAQKLFCKREQEHK